jgi:hypothetical protein
MARTLYGGSPADVIAQVSVDDGDYAPATAPLTAWDALADGTQLTDLTTQGGSAISVVTPDGVGRVLFYGPDGHDAEIWLQDAAGTRWRIDPADLASRVTGGATTGTVESVNGVAPDGTGDVALDADDIGDGTTGKQYTATEKTKLAGIATEATANDTDAELRDRTTHTGIDPISALPAGATIRVFAQTATGYWPTSYAADGTPSYTGGAQETGERPTARDDVSVDWVQVVEDGLYPPGVASGTAGMRQGRDFRFKVQPA